MSADSDREPLPTYLTDADVRAAAAEAETMLEAQNLLRVGRTRAYRLLRDRDLLDQVQRAGPEAVARLREELGGAE